jgi:hypothetical protein
MQFFRKKSGSVGKKLSRRAEEQMIMSDFLASAASVATDYIKCTVTSSNKVDYQKLKKIFDSKFFEARNFEDVQLDILSFDWQGGEHDRNWWWQLQALPFLNWFSNSFSCQSDEERKKYFSTCLSSVECWIANAKNNKKSPLVWHDHAAAFRLRNLANWLLFCHIEDLPISDDPRCESLASLVVEHLNWLQSDANYSKFTNHGFDQALITLTVGLMFDREDFEPYRRLNRQRLKDEVTFAFTDEGVHKENSPGYQKMMLGRLKQLRALTPLGEREISELGERYIGNAQAFLKAITLPNGYLPMIGDTQGNDKGLEDSSSLSQELSVYDYSASGYVIVKGCNDRLGSFYFLIKSSHDSNYHRHDDDLMLYLWCNGDVLLGDAGLFTHDERSSVRKFMRSHLAHSVPFIKGKPVRDRGSLLQQPTLSFDHEKMVVKAKSYAFGSEISRVVDLCKVSSGVIGVRDQVSNSSLFVNYYLGSSADISMLRCGEIKVKFDSAFCTLKYSPAGEFSYFKGGNGDSIESCFVSNVYGQKEDSSRILLSMEASLAEAVIEFGVVV